MYDANGFCISQLTNQYGGIVDSMVVKFNSNHTYSYSEDYISIYPDPYYAYVSVAAWYNSFGKPIRTYTKMLTGNSPDNLEKFTYDANGNVLTHIMSISGRTSMLTFTYQTYTGIESETKDQSQFSIYPNPCQNTFTVDLKDSKRTSIIIRNMQGQKLKSITLFNTSNSIIDISELPKGIYFVTILSEEKCSTQKLVKGL